MASRSKHVIAVFFDPDILGRSWTYEISTPPKEVIEFPYWDGKEISAVPFHRLYTERGLDGVLRCVYRRMRGEEKVHA